MIEIDLLALGLEQFGVPAELAIALDEPTRRRVKLYAAMTLIAQAENPSPELRAWLTFTYTAIARPEGRA